MNTELMFSSVKQDWQTPDSLFTILDNIFNFTIDLAADSLNTKCTRFYDEEADSLKQDWSCEVGFLNPPYGRGLKNWVKKASEADATTVMLIPARVDTLYFHSYIFGKAKYIVFLRGRLKFGGAENSAPFPSALVIYTTQDWDLSTLENLGYIVE